MHVREIVVDASPGDTIERAMLDSIDLAWKHSTDVIVVHNEDRYRLSLSKIQRLVSVAPEKNRESV